MKGSTTRAFESEANGKGFSEQHLRRFKKATAAALKTFAEKKPWRKRQLWRTRQLSSAPKQFYDISKFFNY